MVARAYEIKSLFSFMLAVSRSLSLSTQAGSDFAVGVMSTREVGPGESVVRGTWWSERATASRRELIAIVSLASGFQWVTERAARVLVIGGAKRSCVKSGGELANDRRGSSCG